MNLFGTDGIRGKANEFITPKMCFDIGAFLGCYNKKNTILIAMDTRISGQLLLTSIIAGVLSTGGVAHILGVAPTPALAYLCKKHNYDYGIMISASHNPYPDNGIKIFSTSGFKISAETEEAIENHIKGTSHLPECIDSCIGHVTDRRELLDEYVSYNRKAYRDTLDLRLLVDGANGSASSVIHAVLKDLKLQADIINVSPNGTNINENCGSTHLETIQSIIKANIGKYDLGVAFDGDADRVLFVDPKGNIINGDHVLFLLAKHYKQHNLLPMNTVVATVMSNLGLFNGLKELGIDVVATKVGDKYVQREMVDKGFLLGGEQSGHTIFNGYIITGDGIFTLMNVLDVLAANNTTFAEYISEFEIFPQTLINIKVVDKELAIKNPILLNQIKISEEQLGSDGRILVRPSGTEQLVRVMVEAKTIDLARSVAEHLATFVK